MTQVVANLGAMLGGTLVGYSSQMLGRRLSIIIMCTIGGALVYPYTYVRTGHNIIAAAFFEQFMVQGAWGVIPVHLNELSPDDARGTFPGFTYQLGNLIASVNATLQAAIAVHYGNDYALALAVVAGVVAVAIVILTAFGVEAKGVAFGTARIPAPALAKIAANSAHSVE